MQGGGARGLDHVVRGPELVGRIMQGGGARGQMNHMNGTRPRGQDHARRLMRDVNDLGCS